MIDATTPAGRLHLLIAPTVNGDPETRMLEVWAGVMQTPANNDVEISRRLMAAIETVEEIKRLISQNAVLNQERYLGGMPKILDALRPIQLQSNRRGAILPNITPDVLTRLEFCDEELRRSHREHVIEGSELSEIRKATDELFESVANSSMNPDLRIALLEGLERVRLALSLYVIHGAKGLRTALQQIVGLVFTEAQAIKAAKNQGALSRLVDLLDKLDAVTSKALKIKKALTGPVRALLKLAYSKRKGSGATKLPETNEEQETSHDVIDV